MRRVQGQITIKICVISFFIFFPFLLFANSSYKKKLDSSLKSLVINGSVLVANDKKIIYRFSSNKNLKLIPASVIKIMTALAALHYLGLDFQFSTDFYVGNNGTLLIRGRGDPFLVSETWRVIAKKLKNLNGLPRKFNNISFDNSLFSKKIKIPGVEFSSNPYDAANGALVVNFNTVFLEVGSNGQIFSAEKQTPLTPLALRLGKKLMIGKHRIKIPVGYEILYAGELVKEIFGKEGISFNSSKVSFQTIKSEDVFLYTHFNENSIKNIISGMMLYSNNFIANQLLLSIGLKRYGAPATLFKGNQAIKEYLVKKLKIPLDQFDIEEGSGISRKNRLTSDVVLSLLRAFSNKQYLLNNHKGVYLKTGTLRGVYTMAGYLKENLYFVILLNQKKNNREKILDLLLSVDSY